jgi:ABC-type oligopeptide transport system substrate-binding subunit
LEKWKFVRKPDYWKDNLISLKKIPLRKDINFVPVCNISVDADIDANCCPLKGYA